MMKESRCGVGMNAQRKVEGKNCEKEQSLRALLTRVRLEHYQSAPKPHPEEQQITQEDKREGEWKQRGGGGEIQEGWRGERSGKTDIKGTEGRG